MDRAGARHQNLDGARHQTDDPHGGVAIYVKNSLICKERHDLSIPQLEAVWIETKIGQDKLLIGSFYRPPNSKSDYWNLIDQSIKIVYSTPHKFIFQHKLYK